MRTCPHCYAVIDDQTHLGLDLRKLPKEGDVLICMECGGGGACTKDGMMRKFTAEEERGLMGQDARRVGQAILIHRAAQRN